MAVNDQRVRRQRLSYLISDDVTATRHRFGVNCTLLNQTNTLLYTAGRDAVIRCWDVSGDQHEPQHLRCFQGHADWVNALAATSDDRFLVSASSDTTLKLWNLGSKGNPCAGTLRRHEDYVKALALASQRDILFSGGLDRRLITWDLRQLLETSSTTPSINDDHSESIYSVATNSSGSIAVTGSSDKTIRTFDPRTTQRITSLKGHGDNIKTLAVSDDGTKLLSGSSDCTVKLWDLGQQRCIATYRMHGDSVWSMHVDPGFHYFYSGGRDQAVFYTDLLVPEEEEASVYLFSEQNPILDLRQAHQSAALWVSTTDSSLNCWEVDLEAAQRARTELCVVPEEDAADDVEAADDADAADSFTAEPLCNHPAKHIPGLVGLVQHQILNDRIHVLTKDAAGCVAKWNLLTGTKVHKYGAVDFEKQVEAEFIRVAVPAWCGLDTKLGSLSVHLDEPECFAAWAQTSALCTENVPSERVNIGGCVIQVLLRDFQLGLFGPEGGGPPPDPVKLRASLLDKQLAHDLFQLPEDTPVILSQRNDMVKPLTVFALKNSAIDSGLRKHAGAWLIDALSREQEPYGRKYSVPARVIFHLQPHAANLAHGQRLPKLQTSRLMCPDVLVIGKVCQHVVDSLKLDPDGETDATAMVDVLCQEQVLTPELTLATVKQFWWKRSDELVLTYRKRMEPDAV
eukprot:m.89541 g.89541  ORF g.89541 m.89541 type:complete len:683 (-) comp14975_c0_seq4:191-2239(-)